MANPLPALPAAGQRLRPAQESDLAVPQPVQMLQRQRRAAFVVHANGAHCIAFMLASRHYRRNLPLRQIREQLDVRHQPVGNDDQALHAAVQQHFQIAFEAVRFIVRVRQKRQITRLIERIFQAAQNRRAERIGNVEHHHADNVGALAAQRTRQRIRPVAQALRRCFNFFFRVSGDVARERRAVQHNGNRRGRVAAFAGHIANRYDSAVCHTARLTLPRDSCN